MKASVFLIDTHVLLWWLFGDASLSTRAYDIIQSPDHEIFVSSACGWEISTKHGLGKLPHAGEAVNHLPALLQRSHMAVFPITLEHAMAAGALPGPHRDPFDRMLIAQSQLEGIPIVTSDKAFYDYPVTIVW